MPEETPGTGLSPGKVVHPCKKQLTEYRHLERSLIILRVLYPTRQYGGKRKKREMLAFIFLFNTL